MISIRYTHTLHGNLTNVVQCQKQSVCKVRLKSMLLYATQSLRAAQRVFFHVIVYFPYLHTYELEKITLK